MCVCVCHTHAKIARELLNSKTCVGVRNGRSPSVVALIIFLVRGEDKYFMPRLLLGSSTGRQADWLLTATVHAHTHTRAHTRTNNAKPKQQRSEAAANRIRRDAASETRRDEANHCWLQSAYNWNWKFSRAKCEAPPPLPLLPLLLPSQRRERGNRDSRLQPACQPASPKPKLKASTTCQLTAAGGMRHAAGSGGRRQAVAVAAAAAGRQKTETQKTPASQQQQTAEQSAEQRQSQRRAKPRHKLLRTTATCGHTHTHTLTHWRAGTKATVCDWLQCTLYPTDQNDFLYVCMCISLLCCILCGGSLRIVFDELLWFTITT